MALQIGQLPLQGFDLSNPSSVKIWQNLVAQSLNNLIIIANRVQDPVFLASILNGSRQINAQAISNILVDVTDSAATRTVDSALSNAIYISAVYTGAATYTLTVNNIANGAAFYLRLSNTSGAPRTFTVLANDPSSNALNVIVHTTTANNNLSAGISINSGSQLNAFGIRGTHAGVAVLDMVGVIL